MTRRKIVRTPGEFARIYGSPDFRSWCYRQSCLVVGCQTTTTRPNTRSNRPLELCHIGNEGKGRKAEWRGHIWIGCWIHHDMAQDVLGPDTFAARHHLAVNGVTVDSLEAAAKEVLRQYEAWEGGLAW